MTDLLRALGRPADALVSIDFETFYSKEYGLRTLTTEAYVRDPRFEVIGVGVKWGDRPSVWLEEWEFREWAARVDWSRVAVNAHHTQFDGFILSHHYGIKPGFLLDTMSMARALNGPLGVALKTLGPKYGVGQKGDEVENTKGKRRADFTLAEWLRFGAYCNNDTELTSRLLVKMLRGFPPLELWAIDSTIRWFTEPVFVADLAVLERTLIEERRRKAAMLERSNVTAEDLRSADKFAALLRSSGIEPERKAGKNGPIFAFAQKDPQFVALLEHEREEIRFLAEARLSAQSNQVETRVERLIGVAKRGAVPFYLKYAGAHTGRLSGGDKMNPQNFNRGGALRAAILAPEGHTLVVADSGQIEARVVGWVAGQADLLETFRRNDSTGGDFYSDVGGSFFGKKLSKKDTPVERQVSKSMVLGLGFGMGVFKFAGELLKGMLGAPPVQFIQADVERYRVDVGGFEDRTYQQGTTCGDKVEEMITFGVRLDYPALLVHCAVADHFVRLYRSRNSRIAGFWKLCDGVLHAMEVGRKMTFGPKGCLRVIKHGIVKPNGLTLHYPELRRGKSGYTYLGSKQGRAARTHIYGGLLTENIVQSLARDVVVAEQALRIRAAGYRTATTTHDEIACVEREERGPECLTFMLKAMKQAPSWCDDLPLWADGGIARSYGSAK